MMDQDSESKVDPLAWIGDELSNWQAAGLRRTLTTRCRAQGPLIEVDGRKLVNFGSNDYLCLAADARVVAAAQAAIAEEGWGAGASPLVTGHSESQARLEARLAEFERAEAALVFPSGFSANAGTIAALVGADDAIFSDERNHASLIDGCRLSRAAVHVYPHGDVVVLARAIDDAGCFRRRLIVTDSIFSMDGDAAPLVELADLAERSRSMLMVDEAHATGVFGDNGRGLCEALGIADRVHVRVGTLSKALGSVGGFVVGSRSLIDWLLNRARPYVFSTALPAAAARAALAALDIVRDEPARRRELLAKASALRQRLSAQGWNTDRSASQIVPLILGAADATMRVAGALREAGFFVPGIRPPSVPEGHSLLRISLTCGHTDAMIDGLIAALARIQPGSAA